MHVALGLFLSPLPTIRLIISKKSISEYSEFPYITGLCNCVLWVAYAIATPGRVLPLITNIAGLSLEVRPDIISTCCCCLNAYLLVLKWILFQLAYCAVFLTYSENSAHARVRSRLLGASFSLIIIVALAFVAFEGAPGFLGMGNSGTTDALGIAACFFNISMFGSPLAVIGKVRLSLHRCSMFFDYLSENDAIIRLSERDPWSLCLFP